MKKIYNINMLWKTSKLLNLVMLSLLLCFFTFNGKAQYCYPTYNNGTGSGDYISLVNIAGTTLNNSSLGAGNPYYTLFPATGNSTGTLTIGSSYTINVAGGTFGTSYISAWGDWNQDGVFDASEYIATSPNAGNQTNVVLISGFTIPVSAVAGATRIRFRENDTYPGPGATEACGPTSLSAYGEGEDYTVYLASSVNCAAVPAAGNATASQTLVCAGASFNLGLIGNSANTAGLSYQWQFSPTGTVWTNLGTAQSNALYYINNLPSTTYYHCVITCTGTAQSATSTAVNVTFNPLINCYCTPSYSWNCSGDNFTSFSLANLTAQTTSCTPGTGYTDMTTDVPSHINLNAGVTYTLNANTSYSGSGGAAAVGVWIDYDHNGVFASNEFTYLGYGQPSYTTSLTVPLTSPSGAVRMRLKMDANFANSGTQLDPCNNNNLSNYGQTADYLVNITSVPSCSAAPNAGNATSTQTLVCPMVSYVLDVAGSSLATGLNYQWQVSPNGPAWSNIGTAQNTTQLSVSTQSSTQHYRCIVTCTSSASSGTSTPVVVTSNVLVNCYCTPGYTWNCSGNNYVNFSLANLSTQTNTCSPSGFTDMTATVASNINMTSGITYTLTAVTANNNLGGNASMGAWIDYDHNSVFDANEFIFLGYGAAGTYTNTITLPLTTAAGPVRMRLVLDANNSPTYIYPCSNTNSSAYGQILDYLVNISAAPLCTGSAVAGNATSTQSTVCTAQAFTLDLLNNGAVLGVSYQWQSSLNGTTWLNLGNASTSPTYYMTSQTTAAQYRCVLTCTNSAGTSTSTPVSVNQNLFSTCYCAPANIYCGNTHLTDATLAGTSNTGLTCNTGYENLTATATTATITAGNTYTLAAGVSSTMNASLIGAWIDFDQNGIFDSYEYTTIGTSTVNGTYTVSNVIPVPFTAIAGITTMRLQLESDNSLVPAILDPCATPTGNGHILDLPVFVVGAPSCSGTPVAGTTVADVATTCFNTSFGLNLTGNGQVSGATYQWQYSPNGTLWTNLAPAQNHVPYTVTGQTYATYYRCVITCAISTLSQTSTPVNVGQNAATACYCIPTGMDCSLNDEIDRVVFGTINNLSGCTPNGYADYTATSFTPATTATIVAGTAYSMTVTLGSYITENVSVWIDYDHNGSFDNSEYTFIGSSVGSGNFTITGNINITPSALNGLTRMRVRNVRNTPFVSGDACLIPTGPPLRQMGPGSSANGETEDYSVYILPADCSGNAITGGLNVSASSPTVCPSASLTLDITGTVPGYTGLTYQWQESPTGSGYTNTGSASSTTSVTTFPTQSNYYICNILCHGSPAATTSTVYVAISAPTITTTASAYTVCPAESVTVTANGATSYTWTTNNVTTASTVFTPTVTSIFPVKGLGTGGCIGNGSILITVKPATNISGTITTGGSTAVAGNAILYKYEPFFTKFDSVAFQPIAGNGAYNFPTINYGIYIVKAVPVTSTLQVTYGSSSISWLSAATITHSCSTADVQNINVIPLTILPPGPGTLSGTIYEGNGFGHRPDSPYSPLAPGQPIGGIVVKGGKNPGGSMFTQTTTGANGTYTLSGLPINTGGAGDNYFILVDIPGLDTNHTYYRQITISNNAFINLDFEVDSAKINPIQGGFTGILTLAGVAGGVSIYPNPANQKVTVSYNLMENSTVKIELYDLLGRSVKTVVQQGEQSSGQHTYSVSLSDLTAGMYFVKLRINNSETLVKLFVTN